MAANICLRYLKIICKFVYSSSYWILTNRRILRRYVYICICCRRYRCWYWYRNVDPREGTWHGKLNRTRDRYHDFVGRLLRIPWRTTFRSCIVPATCSFFTVKRALRTHALFIKRECTEIKFSRISDGNCVSLWLRSKRSFVAFDRNRVVSDFQIVLQVWERNCVSLFKFN